MMMHTLIALSQCVYVSAFNNSQLVEDICASLLMWLRCGAAGIALSVVLVTQAVPRYPEVDQIRLLFCCCGQSVRLDISEL